MPALTVDDLTTLTRVRAPGLGDRVRPVKQVIDAPQGYVDLRDLDPFVHIDGIFDHADSHGGGGTITNGDTQWMTAGSGLLHIEAPPESLVASGGLFHGVQLWVNLPREAKWSEPKYQDIRSREVGVATSTDAGSLVRVIAGSLGRGAERIEGPGSTHTPMTLVHATVEAGSRLDLPWDAGYNALVYVLSGNGTVGLDGRPLRTGQLAVLGAGDFVSVAADERGQETRAPRMEVLVLGGQPINEPVAWAGPFVMNTRAEVVQAFEDFDKGRLGTIPAVHGAPTTLQQG
ncbi:pirin family protein [Marmoricola endophyticus]|nr:pirin-like C-terminal cupin domain-containing protein [Marmoricola endophyticus]